MPSLYQNIPILDPDETPPRFAGARPAAPPQHPPPARRRLVPRGKPAQGLLVTLVFMLVFSGLAMLVVGQVGYSPRLLVGMLATYVIMAALAWRAGRFR